MRRFDIVSDLGILSADVAPSGVLSPADDSRFYRDAVTHLAGADAECRGAVFRAVALSTADDIRTGHIRLLRSARRPASSTLTALPRGAFIAELRTG